MIPAMRLVPNQDGTCNLLLEYPAGDGEFAKEFESGEASSSRDKRLKDTVRSYVKNVRVKTVKILVSGVLVASLAFSSFLSAFAATDRYTMGYLYGGTDTQQMEYVTQANGAMDVVSPSYFDLNQDGSLKLNNISSPFIQSMHQQGIRVVPFLSNHWDREAGINALSDVESLAQDIAQAVEKYDLDGVNVDIENVTHRQRDAYTQLVKLLREKLPAEKEVSVAVAANPQGWETGWHGSYDYKALAQYADHLLIMTYDEHYEGGEAGPVASIEFVKQSLQYALDRVPAEKIVLGIPFYGRIWSTDGGSIAGKGVSIRTILQILETCEGTVTYDENSQSVKAEFTVGPEDGEISIGWNTVLKPGNYVAWLENDRSYQEKLKLVEEYDLKGAGAWSLGQEETSIWQEYEGWVNGAGDFVDAWIQAESVTVYPRGDLTGQTVATLAKGDAISAQDLGNGVCKVQLSNGKTGYVSTKHLTFQQPEQETPSTFWHQVQSGDTLWKISQKYLGSGSRYKEIVALNGLKSETIYPGMKLKIPGSTAVPPAATPEPSRNYTVKQGDTLWKIAAANLGSGSRYTEIVKLNGLTSNTIYPGQQLKLPAK